MANLDEMLAKLPTERQARIYDMANEMMLDYQLQQLQDELTKLGQEHSQNLGIQNCLNAHKS